MFEKMLEMKLKDAARCRMREGEERQLCETAVEAGSLDKDVV